jgi:hypothetical protein
LGTEEKEERLCAEEKESLCKDLKKLCEKKKKLKDLN